MKVLFCTRPHGPPDNTGYDHGVVALAEGLHDLNRQGGQYAWSGTVPYWRRSNSESDWLIPADGQVHWDNADVVVVSYLAWEDPQYRPKAIALRRPGLRTVFLDSMDGWRTFFVQPELVGFDLVLRSHLNRRFPSPKNCRPWAFGLTHRILDACADPPSWSQRKSEFLFNFRIGHPLRDWARKKVLPGLAGRFSVNNESDRQTPDPESPDYLAWAQSGRRHSPSYYRRLLSSQVGAAYGGYFAPSLGLSLRSTFLRALYKFAQIARIKTRTIVQFDSWRLWETFAAGALVVHVDLERYGAFLPVMPINRVHYWAISPDQAERDMEELLATSGETLEQVAQQGRLWAMEHYSPAAQATRLFTYLGLQE